MGLFNRLMGKDDASRQGAAFDPAQRTSDDEAIARYKYMLRTAPPEAIEEAHAEAFARLTPEQRRMVLEELRRETPASELAAADRSGSDPRALARLATRAELREPGVMERTFGRIGGGVPGTGGLGGLMAGSFLSTIAGTVIGSMIAQEFFGHHDLPGIGGGEHHGFAGGSGDSSNDHATDSGNLDTDFGLDDGITDTDTGNTFDV